MTEELDFSEVSAVAVKRLKPRKIVPVPASIVALAQKALDGVPDGDGGTLHTLEFSFKDEERAKLFADLMKHAGDHTSPISSVSVVFPVEDEHGKVQDPTLVRWRAGGRRGRVAV